MHEFTDQQCAKLLANKHVRNVTKKTVSFTAEFKIFAVHQYLSGESPAKIFERAKIPLEFFKDHYARLCIKKWVHKFKTSGEDSLREDGRGSGTSTRIKKDVVEKLTYDELLALVKIQKGALEELKKQRALAKKKS